MDESDSIVACFIAARVITTVKVATNNITATIKSRDSSIDSRAWPVAKDSWESDFTIKVCSTTIVTWVAIEVIASIFVALTMAANEG